MAKHDDGLGWELVNLTEAELDELVDSAESGDLETCDQIVDGAYDRLFGPHKH